MGIRDRLSISSIRDKFRGKDDEEEEISTKNKKTQKTVESDRTDTRDQGDELSSTRQNVVDRVKGAVSSASDNIDQFSENVSESIDEQTSELQQDVVEVGQSLDEQDISDEEKQDIAERKGFLSKEQREDVQEASQAFERKVQDVGDVAEDVGRFNPVTEGLGIVAGRDAEGREELREKSAQVTEGLAEGGASLFNVPSYVSTADTATKVATSEELREDPKGVATAGALLAGRSAQEFTEEAQESPFETTGSIAGAGAGGVLTTPFRINRFKTPRVEGRDKTVRGLEFGTPKAVDAIAPKRFQTKKTVAGAEGFRPERGTPTISDPQDLDVERLGTSKANQGDVFEPISRFEADVTTQSILQSDDPTNIARIRSGSNLLDEAETITGGVRSGRVSDDAIRDVVREADEVDADPDNVVSALSQEGATVYGSGAVVSQADEFRTPGDVDIVVDDKTKATKTLADETELSKKQVKNQFDVKEAESFAGLEEGEVFGFGRFSRSPIETESGIRVNPIGEELQRKAGASLFLRGESVGSDKLDVGPRPTPYDDDILRDKDVDDTIAIAEQLDLDSTEDFARAFGRRDADELQDIVNEARETKSRQQNTFIDDSGSRRERTESSQNALTDDVTTTNGDSPSVFGSDLDDTGSPIFGTSPSPTTSPSTSPNPFTDRSTSISPTTESETQSPSIISRSRTPSRSPTVSRSPSQTPSISPTPSPSPSPTPSNVPSIISPPSSPPSIPPSTSPSPTPSTGTDDVPTNNPLTRSPRDRDDEDEDQDDPFNLEESGFEEDNLLFEQAAADVSDFFSSSESEGRGSDDIFSI